MLSVDQYWPSERPNARSVGAGSLIWQRSADNAGTFQYSDGDEWFDLAPTPDLSGVVTLTGTQTVSNKSLGSPIRGRTSGTLGLWVDQDGWVGILDSATGSSQGPTNTPFAVTHTSAIPEVMADFQLHTTYSGWVALGTNTADAGGTTTSLVDASIDFSTCNLAHLVNPAIPTSVLGAMVEILGGAGYDANDRFRYIQSLTNSNHTINWVRALGAATDNTTSYRIWQPGDNGAMRVLFEQKNGAVQSGRTSEFHAYAQTGAADSGLVTLELSVGTNTPQFDPDNNNGVLSVRASSAWLTNNIGVEQGYGTRYWGELGFRNYWMAQNAAGVFEFKARKGGHQEMTGDLTVGTITKGTGRIAVNQTSGDGTASGLRLYPNGATAHYGEAFVDPNKTLQLNVVQSGVGNSGLLLASNPVSATLTISAPSSLTGSVLEAYISGNGTPRVKFTSSGDYYRQGVKLLGAQGAAVADVASANATDLASVITLANEIKAQVNTAFARLRAATGHGLWA